MYASEISELGQNLGHRKWGEQVQTPNPDGTEPKCTVVACPPLPKSWKSYMGPWTHSWWPCPILLFAWKCRSRELPGLYLTVLYEEMRTKTRGSEFSFWWLCRMSSPCRPACLPNHGPPALRLEPRPEGVAHDDPAKVWVVLVLVLIAQAHFYCPRLSLYTLKIITWLPRIQTSQLIAWLWTGGLSSVEGRSLIWPCTVSLSVRAGVRVWHPDCHPSYTLARLLYNSTITICRCHHGDGGVGFVRTSHDESMK